MERQEAFGSAAARKLSNGRKEATKQPSNRPWSSGSSVVDLLTPECGEGDLEDLPLGKESSTLLVNLP